jgi:hypothetical protein
MSKGISVKIFAVRPDGGQLIYTPLRPTKSMPVETRIALGGVLERMRYRLWLTKPTEFFDIRITSDGALSHAAYFGELPALVKDYYHSEPARGDLLKTVVAPGPSTLQ